MTLPSLLIVAILVGAMASCLGLSLLWRSKVALQLRIDRCVESAALELERIQRAIEASNRRMRIERASAAAAAVPTAGASLRAAKAILTAEMITQEALRMKWRARQGMWILRRGCDAKADAFLPLPSLAWWRPPEDPIGPGPLEWKGSKSAGLVIRLWRSNRLAVATVSADERGGWSARWTRAGAGTWPVR